MLTHFQFDLCHFMNMKVRYPDSQSPQDEILMVIIRWSSLDTFCSW